MSFQITTRGDIPFLDVRFTMEDYRLWLSRNSERRAGISYNNYKIEFVHRLIVEHFTSNNVQLLHVHLLDFDDWMNFGYDFFCNPMLHVENRRCINDIVCDLDMLISGYRAEYDVNANDEPDLYCYEQV